MPNRKERYLTTPHGRIGANHCSWKHSDDDKQQSARIFSQSRKDRGLVYEEPKTPLQELIAREDVQVGDYLD